MNTKSIRYILGWILNIEALLMLVPVGTAVFYREEEGVAYALVMALCAAIGALMTYKKPKNPNFYAKEGFVCTALGWIVMSIFGCLPFMLTGEIPSFVDAMFEMVSGFTTTGASIVENVELLSHCTNMWRCLSHWIGGMGILVFLLAVLPLVGGSNMQLMKAESPGPSVGKLVPKVRFTARILYYLYVALTLLQVVAMLLGGMTLYEALCTSFGTAGTGGFGICGDSIASFSPFLQWAITIFMVAFGVNFNVYFLFYMRKPKDALKCEEMRWYLAIIVSAALLIFVNAYDASLTVENNLRQSFFQVASIITTTGFATTDFNLWPGFSRGILVLLMFIGACAGSTGGGFKVSRIVIGFKSVLAYLGAFLHPRAVRKVKFEDKDVDAETMHAICVYFIAAIGLFVISVLLVVYLMGLMYSGVVIVPAVIVYMAVVSCSAGVVLGSVLLVALDGFDLVSTFTAVAATFNNIGPGLGVAGPSSNFAAFSNFSKIVMTMDMLLGRLEVFPMLMLFYPPLWKESIEEARVRRDRALRLHLRK